MPLIGDLKRFAKKRSKELQQLGAADLTADLAEANVAGQKVTFKLNVERTAAWKLYVELNTRITTQPLDESEGVLREALSSLHAVFGITREILKEAGPVVSMENESLGFYAMEILNQVLRPVLAKWHPALSDWEQQRDPTVTAIAHERNWKRAPALRRELERTRGKLLEYCEALALLSGVTSPGKGT